MMPSTDAPPSHIDELGNQYWLDKDMTQYLKSDFVHSITDMQALIVLHPNGKKYRILVQDGKVVYETQRLEDMAVHIDILKMFKKQK